MSNKAYMKCQLNFSNILSMWEWWTNNVFSMIMPLLAIFHFAPMVYVRMPLLLCILIQVLCVPLWICIHFRTYPPFYDHFVGTASPVHVAKKNISIYICLRLHTIYPHALVCSVYISLWLRLIFVTFPWFCCVPFKMVYDSLEHVVPVR